MSLINEYNSIKQSLARLEPMIKSDIEKRKKMLNENKSCSIQDSILRGYSEELRNTQLKLTTLIKQTPSNHIILIKEYNDLSIKADKLLNSVSNLYSIVKHNNEDDKEKESVNTKVTNMTLEDKRVMEEFTNTINKIKKISREIDYSITTEQHYIEKNSKLIANLTNNVSNSTLKLNYYMNKSSNMCLIITMIAEFIILVLILLSL